MNRERSSLRPMGKTWLTEPSFSAQSPDFDPSVNYPELLAMMIKTSLPSLSFQQRAKIAMLTSNFCIHTGEVIKEFRKMLEVNETLRKVQAQTDNS